MMHSKIQSFRIMWNHFKTNFIRISFANSTSGCSTRCNCSCLSCTPTPKVFHWRRCAVLRTSASWRRSRCIKHQPNSSLTCTTWVVWNSSKYTVAAPRAARMVSSASASISTTTVSASKSFRLKMSSLLTPTASAILLSSSSYCPAASSLIARNRGPASSTRTSTPFSTSVMNCEH